ncbi:MAG: hypothetical protein HY934_02510 [Candidatus Firestonebacteria bacterium]|nr:hypothetical protein [Candidatus Firestonebacteria bacterium]
MFKRIMTETIVKRLKEKKRFIQVIMGPRQVVKTTAIQQVIKEIEVKSGQKQVSSHGLTAFNKNIYPHAKTFIIGLSGINLKDFFEMPITKFV